MHHSRGHDRRHDMIQSTSWSGSTQGPGQHRRGQGASQRPDRAGGSRRNHPDQPSRQARRGTPRHPATAPANRRRGAAGVHHDIAGDTFRHGRGNARRGTLLTWYLDTSFLVRALTHEPGWEAPVAWLSRHPDASLIISDWVVTEFAAALSVKLRTAAIDEAVRAAIADQLEMLRQQVLQTVPI